MNSQRAVRTAVIGWLLLAAGVPAAWSAVDPAAPVGLEAAGISPEVALRYASALDVRDAYNRPVSARLIERQIKTGQTRTAMEASYASRLPHARAAIEILENLAFPASVLSGILARLPRWEESAMPRSPDAPERSAGGRRCPSGSGADSETVARFSAVCSPQLVFQLHDVLRC